MGKGTREILSGISIMEVSEPILLGVFDGMGGGQNGGEAAYIAARNAAEWAASLPERSFDDLFYISNAEICRYAETNGLWMCGTTASIAMFSEDGITIGNIGDSRVFIVDQGRIDQASVDDLLPKRNGEQKSSLSQCLGIPPDEMVIEPHIAKAGYRPGMSILISSDGLTDMVTEDEIYRIIMENPMEQRTGALIDAALAHGGKDNVTVVLCTVI